MLRQHVERADAQRRRVLRMVGDRADRGVAFQHLEAVGRNENAARRLVEPMVGAADALQQTRGALRRADVDDQIDVAPVDAEIERRGAHHRAQPARGHGVLDLAPLRHVERAVMQRDGKRLSSLMCHSAWKIISAWLRVLTNTSVILCCLISS